MAKKKLVVISLGALAGLTGLITFKLKKKERFDKLEDIVSRLIFIQDSLLEYQTKKNEDFEDILDNLVDEVGSVYEHLEYVQVKENEK